MTAPQIRAWGGVAGTIDCLDVPSFSSDIGAGLKAASGADSRCLVIGNLRSYGDEVLNPGGRYVQTTRCDRLLQIDTDRHLATAECGIQLGELQRRVARLGYIVPVTPGTAFLTLGGAIANDIHGKNHHRQGTFGRHVENFELVRTSGEVLTCSPAENAGYFSGTIGGMGLTGAITRATIRLRRIASPLLRVSVTRFQSLSEFFDLDSRHHDAHEYTVAWIDCLATGSSLGRGLYSVADHPGVDAPAGGWADEGMRSGLRVPFTPPISPVNPVTLSLMNSFYLRSQPVGDRLVHYKKWLYPLDSILDWNRLYGKRGFYQFQCVVPPPTAAEAVTAMLEAISARRQGSFLAVLKNFGDVPSPGLMSFPMPGTTLALDFPNAGKRTQDLLLELHRITAAAGGRLYPAKDGCSPATSLEDGYPNFRRFKELIDPGLESSMSRRQRLTG